MQRLNIAYARRSVQQIKWLSRLGLAVYEECYGRREGGVEGVAREGLVPGGYGVGAGAVAEDGDYAGAGEG